MLRKIVLWLALACACAAGAAHANEEAIRKALAEMWGNQVEVEGITKTSILGLYEVRIATEKGKAIVYSDETARYFFLGEIIDNETQTNLTDQRLRKLNAIRFADLPLAQAFKIVRGKGTRQIAYFADPRCPYCRRFDQELAKIDDVTVHVFLLPIIASDSAAVSKAIWCAPDRGKAWVDLMLKQIEPPAAKPNCDTPIEKNLALGQKYRINGTPTFVFADGRRESGAMPAARLSKMLDEASRK